MITVANGSVVSVAANTKSAEQVTGTYQNIGPGVLILVAKAAATGMNVTLSCGGIPLISDQAIPYTGTAGTISINDNVLVTQLVNGGKVECSFRNTTAGAVTVDYMVLYQP
jgi:hypothetical protein